MPPPPVISDPPDVSFLILGDTKGNGRVNILIDFDLADLFPITAPARCQCGLGIGSSGAAIPPSLLAPGAFVDAYVTRSNRVTGTNIRFTPFDTLGPAAAVGPALAAGQVIYPGAIWGGFEGVIQPFTLPTLGPNEVWKLVFEIDVAPGEVGQLQSQRLQFAAGSPDIPGHEPMYSNGEIVPEPSTWLLLSSGLGSLALTVRRGRRARRKHMHLSQR